ncbi:MAG TPA: Hsp33 family molecular chaperone [Alphaproteobacteria bacterium]|nr:Hsp33 family molecular chaperone [Alphaproteobacteria bacterium]HAJ48017.1 Hsp33 family molecular chaperone [Alphaproteobacteria bacterium]
MGVGRVSAPQKITDDFVQTFQIEGMNVRGRIVRLGAVADRVLQAHGYPDPVSAITGEALAIVALLGASLKFDGLLTLQVRSDGPVSMVVADFAAPGTVRACATYDLHKAAKPGAAMLGEGSFALTIDQGADMDRYQGIVPLEAAGLTESVLNYFTQSEQIPTAMRVAAATVVTRDEQGRLTRHWRAGGILVQNIAVLGGQGVQHLENPDEAWTRASILLNTAEAHELVDPQLTAERLLYRLYHEDGVRVFPPLPVQFGCRCAPERVLSVLQTYDREELSDLVVDGAIAATCEFCSATYRFTLDEAGAQAPSADER